jgi:long-chain acyl-CoA synthetase
MGMSFGASSAICRGIPLILEDLQLVRPTVLLAVPTLYKKVYDGVQNKMKSGSYVQDTLLRNAVEIGHKHAEFQRGERGPLNFSERLKYSVLNKIVLSKIRDRFGGNMRYGCVAGAACPTEVLHFMDAIGIPICEGYGLTETSPIITLNVPDNRVLGSVGRPLKDVTVYIVDEGGNQVSPGEEGEICCSGPNIMRGYHNNPEATAEVITTAPDGKSRM